MPGAKLVAEKNQWHQLENQQMKMIFHPSMAWSQWLLGPAGPAISEPWQIGKRSSHRLTPQSARNLRRQLEKARVLVIVWQRLFGQSGWYPHFYWLWHWCVHVCTLALISSTCNMQQATYHFVCRFQYLLPPSDSVGRMDRLLLWTWRYGATLWSSSYFVLAPPCRTAWWGIKENIWLSSACRSSLAARILESTIDAHP